MSIYKECEVCKTKINKLQNIWNIFSGKLEIKCKNCKSKYGVSSKVIDWVYSIFEYVSIDPNGILLIIIFFGGYFFVKYGLFWLLVIIILARKLINIILLLLCKLKRLEDER
ncbi:hypothetical protein [Campylobacter insulaenigrae]|uniref:hypothetical protein n=1 Tax=Campylobacter insulaenigrae TaxID=260714 RepID=UPI00242D55BC|nr:hypothetical protein [Campylobacter insulaenigrae]